MSSTRPIDVTIVGGGMITHDLILPCIYHMQRTGSVKDISICALNNPPLKELEDSAEIRDAFPGQSFTPYPSFDEGPAANFPDLYKDAIAGMDPFNAVVVAMPDQLHYAVVMEALKHNQHVLCVKPLVLKYDQAMEIEKLARDKGLFIGIEYHKRFDRRSLLAR
ncbi:MAG: Gfo/Idh/MocA family oxidoreductase, partial [bacterium]|nr:Gfo/Idh/MocA family oxidoreductase [bacterium]